MEQTHVLVIENDPDTQRRLAKLILESGNRDYLTAQDGVQGLNMAIEEQPDLIILNSQLPERDGLAVLESLREQGVSTPVIVLSEPQSPEQVVRAFRLGAYDYLFKPFDSEGMSAAIQEAIAEAQSRRKQQQLTQQLQEANQKLEWQLQELNTLYAVGRSVTSVLDLNHVLNRVVEAAVYMAGADEGMLMLLDEESEELYLRAAKDVNKSLAQNMRMRVDDSIAGRALQANRPVHISGEKAKVVTGYLVKALLYVPLQVPGRGAIGVLGVANRTQEKVFSERDIFLLSALADYAAIAVENARLFKSIKTEQIKLETVLKEANELIIVADEENNILLCNAAARAAFGLDGASVLSRSIGETISHPVVREMFVYGRENERAVHREIVLDDERTFNAQLTPIENVGQVLMMQDITHLKELDRIKSEFVTTVSHDLRTPLTSIQGYVELLPQVGSLNEQQENFIRRVRQSLSLITELISDLLDVGRIEAGLNLEMSACDPLEIIENVIQNLQPQAEEKQQELRWEAPDSLPMIQGNVTRLRQVMNNLINNAIKYTPEGGWIAVSAAEDDGHIVIRVSDNGVGIPVKQQPYIFDKFYRVETEDTADIEGTGLGLAIVKAVVEKHNGRVWVESKLNEGSTFSVVLPALEE
jgi:two-component system NtrC family sensor kinase